MSLPEPPAYLGRVLASDATPAGTCFQVRPGVLATAWHVLKSAGASMAGDQVLVDPLGGGEPTFGTVRAFDAASDLAVFTVERMFALSVPGLVATDSVPATETVAVTGVPDLQDVRTRRWMTVTGVWQGVAMGTDGVAEGRMECRALVRGMSGAPVQLLADDQVVGIVRARYNNPTGWLRDTVWLCRTEDLMPLLVGIADMPLGGLSLARVPHRDLQQVRVVPTGDELSMSANVDWVMAGQKGVVGARAHFTRHGMGRRRGVHGGDLFRGRAAALTAVKEWLGTAQAPGRAMLVTGQAGAGKSAVLGRVALDLEAERCGQGLAFHARQASLADLLEAVADLISSGVAADEIDGMVEQVRSTQPVQPWRIMIDALDEAGSDAARRSLVDAIVELAGLAQVRVVVATRTLAAEHRFTPGGLLNELGVASATESNFVDLDDDRMFDQDGLLEFTEALLGQEGAATPTPPDGAWARYRSDEQLCRRLGRAVAFQAGRNYLVAALAAGNLSRLSEPIDPAAVGFDMAVLPSSVGTALSKYLERLAPHEKVRVLGLLTALAYARGDGIDDQRWLDFVERIGYEADRNDLHLLRLSPAADYLLQTTLARQAPVTRLFHQALADELLTTRPRQFDEGRILEILIPTASVLAGEGPPTYVRQFLVAHAAAAGLLDDDHVPTDFLPWETSGKVSVVLGFPRPQELRCQHLIAWAALEQYLADADLTTRRRSLAFAIAASDRRGITLPSPPPKDGITPQWTHWLVASNILAHLPDKASIRAVTTFTNRYGRQLVAAGCRDSKTRVWDLATGEQAGQALTDPEATGSIWAVTTFHDDDGDQLLAACGEDGAVRIWNLNGGRETTLLGHTGPVRGIATFFGLHRRHMLATASYDHTVRIWDLKSATLVREPLRGHTDGIHSIAAFADANGAPLLATGGCDGTLRIWNPAHGTETRAPIVVFEDWVRAVLPVKDHLGRQLIATGGNNRRIRFWDPDTGQEAREPLTLPGPGRVTSLACIADDREDTLLVSGGTDRVVRIWSLRSGQQTTVPKIGHGDWISSVAGLATSDGRELVVSAAGPDCTVRLWDPRHGESETSGQNLGWLRGVAFSPDNAGRLMAATCGGDEKVRIWDAVCGTPGSVMEGHGDWVRTICALHEADGRSKFVTGGDDKTVRIWDIETGSQEGDSFKGNGAAVWAVTSFADPKNGTAIASGDDANRIIIWHPDGTANALYLDGHTKGVRGLTTFRSCDGNIALASVSADHTLRLWDPSDGSAIQEPIQAHTAPVRAVSVFTLDGTSRLVTAGCDNAARIWDPATGKQLAEFPGHTGWVLTVATATHTCGRTVLITGAGYGDQSVRVWDVPTQRQLGRIVVGAQVQSVAAWPHDTPTHEATIAIATVAGVAMLRLTLDLLCASPSCAGTPA